MSTPDPSQFELDPAMTSDRIAEIRGREINLTTVQSGLEEHAKIAGEASVNGAVKLVDNEGHEASFDIDEGARGFFGEEAERYRKAADKLRPVVEKYLRREDGRPLFVQTIINPETEVAEDFITAEGVNRATGYEIGSGNGSRIVNLLARGLIKHLGKNAQYGEYDPTVKEAMSKFLITIGIDRDSSLREQLGTKSSSVLMAGTLPELLEIVKANCDDFPNLGKVGIKDIESIVKQLEETS